MPLHFEFIDRMICGGCKRIAVMGTMHEIGFFEGSINENTPCNPMNLYGIAKCSLREITELMCKDNHVPLQWLRAFYIVGNTAQGSSVFSKIVQAEQKGDKFFPFTSGLNQYDFIDYDFFCKAVALTLEQDSVTGIINICSGRPQKLSERVERFLSENDFKIKLDYGRFAERPYDSKAIWGDDAKLSSILKMFE